MDMKVMQSNINQDMLNDVIAGLQSKPKTLPCKYFYDETGSRLFEKICDLPEYYITRTEIQLLHDICDELVELIGKRAIIIEPGAGAGIKIQNLLNALDSPKSYVPIDISPDFLRYSANKIKHNFPDVQVNPIQADFTHPIEWQAQTNHSNRLVFFPGSTIGNFSPEEAQLFLTRQKDFVGEQGAILIGVDLVKSSSTLEAAYNDARGVTAEFNLNLLKRINNQLSANFDLKNFKHHAFYNRVESRIEMHLQSCITQSVSIQQHNFDFLANETIHTENSYKYSIESFTELAERANLKVQHTWYDAKKLISIHYLT